MTEKSDLPRRVFVKNGSYYYVRAVGKKRVWTKLSRVRMGLPDMYKALAEVVESSDHGDNLRAVVTQWLIEVGSRHSKKTQANDAYMCREIMRVFDAFRVGQIKPPHISEFLAAFTKKPRTYNAYRSQLRELMRFAESKGWREPGTNPVDSLRTMTVKPRSRYITDSELRRIKVAACYYYRQSAAGPVKTRVRSGLMMCNMVDMAYLTGQRIGDLVSLQWSQIKRDGILFEPAKVEGSTGVQILIKWTPKLQAVVSRLKAYQHPHFRFVFAKLNGQPYQYSGVSTAWKRAVKRSGVKHCTFHDIRAKAVTDVDDQRGMAEARKMGGHSTEQQTAAYVRHKTARKTVATR